MLFTDVFTVWGTRPLLQGSGVLIKLKQLRESPLRLTRPLFCDGCTIIGTQPPATGPTRIPEMETE